MTGAHHTNPVVGEAVIIAFLHRQWVLKISGTDSPVDIIAFDKVGLTLVHAVRSKKPINDAHTAMGAYSSDIESLCAVGHDVPCNRALWITSRRYGWVWYEVARCSLARMDTPFSPQIRYTWDGSFKARGTDHPIRTLAVPDLRSGAVKVPVTTPGNGSILR